MARKTISIITLISFFFFSVCCASHSVVRTDAKKVTYSKGSRMLIVGVQTTSGDYIEFSEKDPATLSSNSISGMALRHQALEINLSDIAKLQKNQGEEITGITTVDGTAYDVLNCQQTEDKIILRRFREPVSIPLSQADLVWVYKTNSNAAILAGAAAVLVAVVVISLVTSSSSKTTPARTTTGTTECCPFIYSFSGDKYVFDAEPFGGAICQGLERTEWSVLDNLKETDGRYRIRMVNELEETQHINELALQVIDHPKDTIVATDPSGKIHTLTKPIVPDKALDSKGNDLRPYLIKNDRVFWISRIEGVDPEHKENLRDELLIEFPKPRAAKRAKLLVNACTTQWGSHVVRRYLDLYGDTVDDWYKTVRTQGAEYYRFVNMHVRDELYALHIRVQTEKGWVSKGFIRGGGPLISKDQVYPLDISDIPGDLLRIKLTPPVNFWMINHLAVDYSDDLPFRVTEIDPAEASDDNGRDIRQFIAADDNDYHIMPGIGDQAEFVFEAPPLDEGVKRSLILKVKGYYDIHLDAKGEPQLDMIERLQKEPGFVVEHAFTEYLKWKNEMMSR